MNRLITIVYYSFFQRWWIILSSATEKKKKKFIQSSGRMKLPHNKTTKEQSMNYRHLSIEERCCIRQYYNEGISYRKIAELIGRSASTICREINRNRSFMNVKPAYYPHTAQKKYLLRRSYCHRGMYWNEEVIAYIYEKLKATWSPEQISCTPCELEMPSTRTIYRWIYEKILSAWKPESAAA